MELEWGNWSHLTPNNLNMLSIFHISIGWLMGSQCLCTDTCSHQLPELQAAASTAECSELSLVKDRQSKCNSVTKRCLDFQMNFEKFAACKVYARDSGTFASLMPSASQQKLTIRMELWDAACASLCQFCFLTWKNPSWKPCNAFSWQNTQDSERLGNS